MVEHDMGHNGAHLRLVAEHDMGHNEVRGTGIHYSVSGKDRFKSPNAILGYVSMTLLKHPSV
jgi:hypothetical protein